MKLHTDFFEKLHENFLTMKEDAVIEGFYKFLKDIAIESNIDYPREIDISSVTGTSIKFTDTKGNTIGIIEPVKKENFNYGIQLKVDDQVLGLFISDEYIATAIAPTPVPMQEGGNPKSIVTLDSFKQLAIYTLEELGLSFTEDGFIEIDKGDNSLSSVGFVKQQLDALKQEIIGMIPTNEEISRLATLPRGSIIVWTSKDIPTGWVICDGTKGTPDMRDKFIVGASNNRDINVTGGHGTTSISLEGLEHYHGVGHNTNLRTDGDAGWGWNFSTNGLKDIPVELMPSSHTNTKYYFKCQNEDHFSDHNWLAYVDTNNKMYNFDGTPVDRFYSANPATYNVANFITSGAFSGTMDSVTHWSNGGASTKELSVKVEPPFYSVYYIMKTTGTGTGSTPETPTPGGVYNGNWVKKTLIPAYFYITLDSTTEGLTDSEVAEIIKNTDVTVISYKTLDWQGAEIPERFPLIYLGKTAEGYKYAFPYSLADTQHDLGNYDPEHEVRIFLQLHNRLSQYNTENSSYMNGLTKIYDTMVRRDPYKVHGIWPATNKFRLALAAEDLTIYRDLDSERTPQDTAKVYYFKYLHNDIEPVPMTFEFLETVRQCTTGVEDKPEDTPDNITPEGVLSPYTVKVRLPEYWYDYDLKFAIYCRDTQSWKEATKVVGDVVYYTFTEEEAEEANGKYKWTFTCHDPTKELSWASNLYETADIVITFEDAIMNDVVTIDQYGTGYIVVGSAYV